MPVRCPWPSLAAQSRGIYAAALLALGVLLPAVVRAQSALRTTLGDAIASAEAPGAPRRVVEFEASPQRAQTSAARGGVKVLQVVLGAGAALGGGLVGLSMLRNVGTQRVDGDWGYSRAGQLGWILGSMLGSATTVVLVGKLANMDGSILGAYGGATVATIPQLLFLDVGVLPLVATVYGGGVLQSGFATGGYYLGR
jgi:hypothetical protein